MQDQAKRDGCFLMTARGRGQESCLKLGGGHVARRSLCSWICDTAHGRNGDLPVGGCAGSRVVLSCRNVDSAKRLA